MPPSDSDTDILVFCAAYLAEQQKSQKEIMGILGLGSQSHVSRLLKTARARRILRLKFDASGTNPVLLQEIHARCDTKEGSEEIHAYAQRVGIHSPPTIRVFSSGDTTRPFPARMETFAQNAAPYIRDLLRACRTAGFAWGQTLRRVVNVLQGLRYPTPWVRGRIEMVPLAGDALSEAGADTASSALAEDLEIIVNGFSPESRHSLGMVPAFIPDFPSAQQAAIWALIAKVRSYQQIFGRDSTGTKTAEGIVDRLDAVFTSVGPHNRVLGWGTQSQLVSAVEQRRISVLTHGDFGGVLIPRNKLTKQQVNDLDAISRRWTGLDLDMLKNCYQRAISDPSASGTPGNVAICTGVERADFIFELLRSDVARDGLVNVLIIDPECRDRLLLRIKDAGGNKTISKPRQRA